MTRTHEPCQDNLKLMRQDTELKCNTLPQRFPSCERSRMQVLSRPSQICACSMLKDTMTCRSSCLNHYSQPLMRAVPLTKNAVQLKEALYILGEWKVSFQHSVQVYISRLRSGSEARQFQSREPCVQNVDAVCLPTIGEHVSVILQYLVSKLRQLKAEEPEVQLDIYLQLRGNPRPFQAPFAAHSSVSSGIACIRTSET